MGSRVVVNCYSNFNSYVQGKQSVLFQKIIATAIELLKDGHSAVETLNNYHALTITHVEVENNFEILLPYYKGSRNDKNYINLLSAVYNTMLTGYMPEGRKATLPNAIAAYDMGINMLLLTGNPGVAIPENIMVYSIAIRGIRHTYYRMACSINR